MSLSLVNTLWMLVCSALVFVMQAGFLCLESGLTRSKNAINVALKNLTDFAISLLIYWAVGFGLMYGVSCCGIIGTTRFFESTSGSIGVFFLFQSMFCATAATIVSGAVTERMKFSGYVFIVIVMSILIYPLVGHWIWGGVLGGERGWLAEMGFRDFAGSTVVHSVGGWVALAAVLVIGPRIGRFSQRGCEFQTQGTNLPLAMLGTLLIWFGWIGFNGGSQLHLDPDDTARIIANTLLAGSAGFITALATSLVLKRRADVHLAINGSLAGLVAITASCDIAQPHSALVIGSIGAMIMSVALSAMNRFRIDDAVGATAVHAAAGVWGTLAVAFVGSHSLARTGLSLWEQLGVQLLGVAVTFVFTFFTAYVIIGAVHRFIPLRVTAAEEKLGLNIVEHGASTDLYDLMSDMDQHYRTGDFSRLVAVEPGTEVGQIARHYNRVLDRVSEEANTAQSARSMAERGRDLLRDCTLELCQSNEQLRLEMNTRRQAEEALREKGRRLGQKQKLEAIGQLTAGVAHEFNNLLQAIRGHVSFAAEDLGPDHVAAADLKHAISATRRGSRLTAQLLDFRRPRQVTDHEPLLLNRVLESADVLLRPLLGATIELCIDPFPTSVTILGDEHALQQVLVNLAINARDAMNGPGRIDIAGTVLLGSEKNLQGMSRHPSGQDTVDQLGQITVTDDGCGMPSDVCARIFEPFFTTKEVGKGTGLGLSVVYGTIQQHGGCIDVSSDVNKGTTFRIRLPLVTTTGEDNDVQRFQCACR